MPKKPKNPPKPKRRNRYADILEDIFFRKYGPEIRTMDFKASDIYETADRIGVERPDNKYDAAYQFRSRNGKTEKVKATEAAGLEWIIRGAGRGKYRFELVKKVSLAPNPNYAETKIPDATPSIISRYALSDEQALLAKIRFNRLIDIFTGLTCYSMQSHLRTYLDEIGQIETDEFYLGIDKHGAHYALPVEAKGERDRLGIVQIENNFALGSKEQFSNLICRPIAAQFRSDEAIVLMEFEINNGEIKIVSERHYRLVPTDQLTDEEILSYRNRLT